MGRCVASALIERGILMERPRRTIASARPGSRLFLKIPWNVRGMCVEFAWNVRGVGVEPRGMPMENGGPAFV